jgi:hypothetical protein
MASADVLSVVLMVVIVLLTWLLIASYTKTPPHMADHPIHHLHMPPLIAGHPIRAHDPYPYNNCYHDPKACDFHLNDRPAHVAHPSHPINETPEFVGYAPSCTKYPTRVELASSGTGVGEPSFVSGNERPAPYTNMPAKCSKTLYDPHFNPDPSHGDDETNAAIDYPNAGPRVRGFACQRPSGVGEPSFEKLGDNERQGAFKSASKLGGCPL